MKSTLKKLFHKFYNAVSDNEFGSCICPSHNGLALSKQQLNRTIFLLLLSSLFIFVGGYFFGQHSATEQLLSVIDRDSFADQVYYSMCNVNEQRDDGENDEPDATIQTQETSTRTVESANLESTEQVACTKQACVEPVTQSSPLLDESAINKQAYYQAQLAGFGSKKSADQTAQRLHRRGFAVQVMTRHSRTARGKMVPWYQVVTEPMTNKDELDRVVAQIKKFEKLRDVKIVQQ